jgi:hypothetical protein
VLVEREIEEWREVPGWPEYEISNKARGRRKSTLRILKPQYRNKGPRYGYFNLSSNGVLKAKYIHRLVAMAFIPNPNNLPLVLHGVKGVSDNTVTNLRWGTNSDNMRDRVRDGTCLESSKSHCPRGHEYTPDNIYWNNAEHTHRKCKICHNERRKKKENN